MKRSNDAVALSERWGEKMADKASQLSEVVAMGPEQNGVGEWTEGIIALSSDIAQIAETIQLLDSVMEFLRCPQCGYQMGSRK